MFITQRTSPIQPMLRVMAKENLIPIGPFMVEVPLLGHMT